MAGSDEQIRLASARACLMSECAISARCLVTKSPCLIPRARGSVAGSSARRQASARRGHCAFQVRALRGPADRPCSLLRLILRGCGNGPSWSWVPRQIEHVDLAAAELTFLKSVCLAYRRLDPVASLA